MRLSASVMAHPVREAQVAELLDHLDRHVPVSWDTAGPPSSDPRQRWATGRRAWEMHDPQADWHMVIQDDAIVVPDLLAGLEAALEWVPERTIVQPYVGTKRPNQIAVAARVVAANDMDASWLSMRSLMWGVAIVVPVAEIAGMLAWCDQIERNSYAYDKRIGVYWRDERRWRTHYTWPALVDHRLALSICGHGHSDRRAHRLWERSALERDWSGPVVTDGRPYGRNRPVKSPKVRMTHPRGRGARLIAENDVPRWKGRGWRIEDEPVEAPVNDVSTDTSSGPTEAGTEEPTSDEDADDEELDAPEGMEIDPSAVRAWAAENDIDVSARGKLPQRVIAAYEAAHDA